MCGITGWLHPSGFEESEARATLTAMTETIRHRGPDDAGAWVDPVAGIALGFRRLAIIDLSPNGRQPMVSATGRYVIVFNGEIYNFTDLRRELEGAGHRFRGHSDTEVLLASVTQWGVRRALERFNGMFAFALWDRQERVLHLARDRAGEKPLYYGWVDGTLLFASELKALRRHPRFRADVDRNNLALYLRHGYVPSPYTIYRGFRKLPPATLMSVRAGGIDAMQQYWSLREVAEQGVAEPLTGTTDDALNELDALLRDAVKIRMEADVPLGAFLSGGVDSSLIVALMQAQSTQPVKTFTIGFGEERYNEAEQAAAVARRLGTEHTELYITPETALRVIPRLPALYDEPFADSSQIPTYLVSELARLHVTVSLSGDAGDELFAGYRRYRLGQSLWSGIRYAPAPVRRGLGALLGWSRLRENVVMRRLDRLTRSLTGKRPLSERLRQASEVLGCGTQDQLFHYMMSFWKSPTVAVPGSHEPPTALRDGAGATALRAFPHRMMYLDALSYLPDDILVKLDRASMAVSLESRIPLLDPRVIAFAWRVPLAMKLRDSNGKWLLRQLLHRYLPPELVDRPKQGFSAPIAQWLRAPLRDWAESLLGESRLRQEGFLAPGVVRRKWQQHVTGVTSWEYDLWTVLMFQAWLDSQAPSRRAEPSEPMAVSRPAESALERPEVAPHR